MSWWRRIALGVGLAAFVGAGCGGKATPGSGGTAGSATGGSGTGGSGTGGVGGNCGASAKSCSVTSDCMLTEASCCVCSDPQLSDYVAINGAYQSSCVCQGPACGCAVRPNPYLGATCKSGTCAGFDVQQIDALSACSSDVDCTLRYGLGCCPACGGSDLIALRADAEGALAKLVCNHGVEVCTDNCAPQPPPNTRAACVQGRCQVVTQ